MKELSLNILDITENSVKAGATLTEIIIKEQGSVLTLTVKDDGCGMTEEVLKSVTNPFYTTRKTRRVGLGIPLLKLSCEQTGGNLAITSRDKERFPTSHGTTLVATFYKDHIDFTPIGDVVSTVTTLIQGHPDTDFLFIHENEGGRVSLDTREIKEVLEDTPINSFEILLWIEDNLKEQYKELNMP